MSESNRKSLEVAILSVDPFAYEQFDSGFAFYLMGKIKKLVRKETG